MAKRYTFTGYDIAIAAYVHLVSQKEIPKPPEGYQYDYEFSTSDREDNSKYELTFTLEKKSEPEPEKPYEAGDWRDPELESK
jgi:hypothetical protein